MASLIFTYAAMNAGKSASLLTAAHNYKERGMGVLVLKPAIDTRDSKGEIVSRIGIRQDANIITKDMDIFEFYKWAAAQKDIHCVFVDEAQFLTTEKVYQLSRIVDVYNVPVMAYGLRTDFKGNLFEGSQALMAIADKLVELKGVCHCGKKATMVARVTEDGLPITDGSQIEIGDTDRYVSLCRKHWNDLTGLL
ncbi:thymidine kinase [Escherichia phage vB_EcoM_ESCO47]|jgi:thymidine kinase|uniref:Thymidine kinase n=26 Tax=Caudoviricetes TaxID=2731619 RepID=A0A6B9WRA9_9CAUD|nr:thymidine kinase [Escherichia coli]NP_861801.1 thymidine kinase [Escherichia phage RB69]YP_009037396.1 thymidine kinase [Escherichia phage vB_EcoM_JS09]YP_009056691.1 thymidine kinase [Escherichia phage vB_EcoM_PhAPEC2]YP_009111271.1 thymidine kinase [Escherichia phage Av-05]YP_009225155.1 thymidine kinase [Escherichia phage APCEc01]YP_009289182.1 thymidine kinase [Shigella phage SHSML-52-1]YP_009608295.1 thymidine kinase [Escherichia phage ST0]YP_010076186.1 thymidine kinase [Shigella p